MGNLFISTPELPSCHAATLTALPNGDLLAAWYAGSREAAPDVAIYGARLPAGATAWSEPILLANTPDRAEGNPVLWTDPRGTVWLFYVTLMGDRWTTSQIKGCCSGDGGHSWGKESLLRPEPGWMLRNRPLVLPDGDWLLPAYDERNWTSFVLISRDEGWSWQPSERVSAVAGVIQPAIVPLDDGRLFMLMRTGGQGGWIWQATSSDGGRTWGQPSPTDIPHNNSGIDLIRLGDGRLLLACNPVSDARWRTPLSLFLSDDQGRTWQRWLDVETGEGEFSYPALLQTNDGTIHLVYTRRRTAIAHVAIEGAP
jgi:predicted neuraminidase